MPVGHKINHNDPEWRKKLHQREYKREWQRAKRALEKGDVASTVEESHVTPTVRLVFSKTNLPHGRMGAVAAAVKSAVTSAAAAVRNPLHNVSTRRAEQEASAVQREAAVQEELREKSEELLAQEKLIEELRAQLAAHHSQDAGAAAAPPTDPPTAPLPKRLRRARPVGVIACECGCEGRIAAHTQIAFASEGRTDDSAARAGRRAVEALVGALPSDPAQCGAVLQAVVSLPSMTDAVKTVGLRTAADASRAERYLERASAAVASMRIKSGSMCKDVQTALDTFCTMLAPTATTQVLQRGKQAAAARAAGLEVPQAQVCGARAFAADFGLTLGTAYKHLKVAIERREKLDAAAEGAYWIWTKLRTGCGVTEEVRRLVHEFYLNHPGVKRSPLRGDALLLPDGKGGKVRVAKLLSEVSLTDIYLDFERAHPGVLKERAFRYLAPPELRRMTLRHLDMCGCRYLCALCHALQPYVSHCSFSRVCCAKILALGTIVPTIFRLIYNNHIYRNLVSSMHKCV